MFSASAEKATLTCVLYNYIYSDFIVRFLTVHCWRENPATYLVSPATSRFIAFDVTTTGGSITLLFSVCKGYVEICFKLFYNKLHVAVVRIL